MVVMMAGQEWEVSWDDARIFLAVAEHGSFSAAARALRVGQPTISRRVAQLEERLGYALFHRGRRGAEVTREGARMLPAAEQMDRWAAEFHAAMAAHEVDVSGHVTIAAPPALAMNVLVPMTKHLREAHVGLTVALKCSVAYVDLARGEADIAIRARPSDEPALVTLATQQVRMVAMAAPSYADTLPDRTLAPSEVNWISWSDPFRHAFPHPQLDEAIEGFVPVFSSDDYLVQLRACAQGLGAMWLPRDLSEAQRDWRHIDVEMGPYEGALHLVCARSMQHVPRVRAVADAIVEGMKPSGV